MPTLSIMGLMVGSRKARSHQNLRMALAEEDVAGECPEEQDDEEQFAPRPGVVEYRHGVSEVRQGRHLCRPNRMRSGRDKSRPYRLTARGMHTSSSGNSIPCSLLSSASTKQSPDCDGAAERQAAEGRAPARRTSRARTSTPPARRCWRRLRREWDERRREARRSGRRRLERVIRRASSATAAPTAAWSRQLIR